MYALSHDIKCLSKHTEEIPDLKPLKWGTLFRRNPGLGYNFNSLVTWVT